MPQDRSVVLKARRIGNHPLSNTPVDLDWAQTDEGKTALRQEAETEMSFWQILAQHPDAWHRWTGKTHSESFPGCSLDEHGRYVDASGHLLMSQQPATIRLPQASVA